MKKRKEIKGKQIFRKKEEILADLKNNKVFIEKMKFAREVFYPALCNASTSIDDAQMLLAGWNTMIMQEFLGLMKEKKIGDLKLEDRLDKTNPKYAESVILLGLFKDVSVFDAKDQIEGMKNEISIFLTDENQTRKLEDLKVKWVDQL